MWTLTYNACCGLVLHGLCCAALHLSDLFSLRWGREELYYGALAGLELIKIYLPLAPKCWEPRHMGFFAQRIDFGGCCLSQRMLNFDKCFSGTYPEGHMVLPLVAVVYCTYRSACVWDHSCIPEISPTRSHGRPSAHAICNIQIAGFRGDFQRARV